MRLDFKRDNQIAGLSAEGRRLPKALLLHVRAVIHARGNGNGNLCFLARVTLALAVGALVGNHFALAVTFGTDPHAHRSAEHGVLRNADLTLSAAL